MQVSEQSHYNKCAANNKTNKQKEKHLQYCKYIFSVLKLAYCMKIRK